METLQAIVRTITFHDPKTGYTVLKCVTNDILNPIGFVGTMIDKPFVEMCADFTGEWKENGTWGKQFKFTSYEEVTPKDSEGIKRYLASGAIAGVGKVNAERIVKHFGDKTVWVLDNEPERLMEISGFGEKTVKKIVTSWKAHEEVKKIMIFLHGCGITSNLAMKIYKKYGEESIGKIKDNPYSLADEIYGVGFKTADSIAIKVGFDLNSPKRIKSGLIYSLNKISEEGGHTYAQREKLVDIACMPDTLNFTADYFETVNKVIDDMISDRTLIEVDSAIYLPLYYWAEVRTAEKIKSIMAFPAEDKEIDIQKIENGVLKRTGKKISYDESQIEAIKTAVRSRITILTGGPGTGKTTVANGIIQAFLDQNLEIVCASPTGRASKRLSETTFLQAKTIHRLLEYDPFDGGFKRNNENPLNGDVLILDECSMIDQLLIFSLLKAVPSSMKIVFIGDVDQLPSVGAGSVFKSFIESQIIPTVRLTTIHRQSDKSIIIENAQRILKGSSLICNRKGGDFFWVKAENETVQEKIKALITSALPKMFDIDYKQIQILCPMKISSSGTESLNAVLQETLNHNGNLVEFFRFRSNGESVPFRIGDKVLQIRNDYKKEVYNGDTGYIISKNDVEQTVNVDFDGHVVTYEKDDSDDLILAYAITIHKSQGSEYPIVIIPILKSANIMLQRNLIYTGVTRAKKIFVFVGQEEAITRAIRNNKIAQRNTRLTQLLSEC